MEKFLIVLAGILISVTSPALGEVIGESGQVEHQPTAWQRLQQSNDPDVVAIRQVLEALIQDRRTTDGPEPQLEARRVDPMDVGRVNALENRLRRLESEFGQLRAKVNSMR